MSPSVFTLETPPEKLSSALAGASQQVGVSSANQRAVGPGPGQGTGLASHPHIRVPLSVEQWKKCPWGG